MGVAKPETVVDDAFEAMMNGEVLKVHGLMNWVGTQALRVSPRAVVRAVAAGLNKT